MNYKPRLDGLRCVAIMMVIIGHFLYFLTGTNGGIFGVNLFFVLSGFLITSILLSDISVTFGKAYKKFIIRRALRIFPVYYLIILFFLAISAQGIKEDWPYLLTYTYNFHVSGLTDWEHHLYSPYWSLSVEEQFYLFFPFEIAFFLSGYICYRLFLKIRQYSCKPKIAWYFLFGMLLFTILFYHLPSVGLKFLPFSLKELFYFLGIIITIPILFHHLKNRTWDNRLGELSYPVYISHMFVGMVCSFQAEKFFKQSWVIALCTIILSFLLNKFISQPIEKIRQARLASKV